jgi:hypothetical protein
MGKEGTQIRGFRACFTPQAREYRQLCQLCRNDGQRGTAAGHFRHPGLEFRHGDGIPPRTALRRCVVTLMMPTSSWETRAVWVFALAFVNQSLLHLESSRHGSPS